MVTWPVDMVTWLKSIISEEFSQKHIQKICARN